MVMKRVQVLRDEFHLPSVQRYFGRRGPTFIKNYLRMKHIIIILAGLLLSLISTNSVLAVNMTGKTELKGKVTDKATGQSVPGVSIYFPDLKTGTVSDLDGNYIINNLPVTKLMIQVSFLGYKTIAVPIDLTVTTLHDFELETAATEINEVVVTGQSAGTEQKRTPAPVAMVPKTALLQNSSTNIIDALAKEPGVSQVTTGTGISKPVIRGLGYNRVVVVNDGIRQEGQQWGDEHGIEIDEFGVNRVEILKGPASLAYGSDAMAGVINMISAPSLPDGAIHANLTSNYQTNNGLIGNSVDFSGNKNGFIWDARYSNKLSHAYQNKYDGYVFNSGFRENDANALLGVNRAWGYSHLKLSLYYMEPGIVEGERDSVTGKFTKTTFLPDGSEVTEPANSSDFKSYHPSTPSQKIAHYKAVWNNNFFIGQSNLKATIGFQQNQRKEFEEPDNYGLFFMLNTLNYDIQYNLPEWNNWKIALGAGGMWQQSLNKGTEFLVPAYHLFDVGTYTILSKQLGDFDVSGGLRFDHRAESIDALYLDANENVVASAGPGVTERFAASDETFKGVSGSLGATWQISNSTYTKLNLSRGYRAPNIAELGSNGVHEGTFRYEIGNPDLKPENSLQLDWIVGMNTEHVSAELDLFHNTVDHFIFSHKLNSTDGGDSIREDATVFKFSQGKAQLYGGEFRLDIHPHPLDWIHFENTFSFVNATLNNQPDSSKYLPLIPPAHWLSDLKIQFEPIRHILDNTYVKFGIDHNWAQDHYYAAFDTETRTPGYTLLNFGAGTDFVSHNKTLCSLYISVNNLTDVAYQSHLSRLKYGDVNNVTGRTGIYNMGRNISFKLLIPIDLSDKSVD